MEHPLAGNPPARAAHPAAPGREHPQAPPRGAPRATGAHRWSRWRAALHARRERIRADARTNRLWRLAVGVVGTAIALLGLALVPLPGPGWLIVLVGLAVLGSEFHWARRTHRYARRTLHRWAQWVQRCSWPARLGLGSASAAAVAAVAWGWLAWQGVPTWVPPDVTASLLVVPGVVRTGA